ncbi:MAG: BatD family protein [Opitutales bacterium]|nr:BatD family protein [Opitutales bacterium]
MKKTILSILTSAIALGAFAQSISTNGFYPPVARKGQPVKYTIVMKDADAQIKPSDIPVPEGLQYIGSGEQMRTSISNMQAPVREKILTFNYIPTGDGEYEIKQWEVTSGGKKYTIAPAKLKVDPNAPQTEPSEPDPVEEMEEMVSSLNLSPFPSITRRHQQILALHESIDLNEEIKAQFKIDANEIYVGQAFICEVSVTISQKVFDAHFRLMDITPEIKNSDAFVCNGFFTSPKQNRNDDGSVSVVFLTVVSPLKAGEFNLQFEARATALPTFRTFPLQTRNVSVISPQKDVKILELPKENMPADFSGAIGNFKIERAPLDENSLSIGEPCVMTVKISGSGNFERFSAPTLENAEGWKSYKPKVSFKDQSYGYAYIGEKTFSYTLVPTTPDIEETPVASFNFFNPDTGKYEVLKTKPLYVRVAPSKGRAKKELEKSSRAEEAKDEPNEIINGGESAQAPQNSIASSPYFWAAQGAVLALLCAAVLRRSRKNRLLDDPAYAQAQAAKKSLKKNLAAAKAAAQKNEAKEFFEAGARALQNALSVSSGMLSGAITRDDAISIMQNIGGGKTEFAAKIFDGADAISFGGYTPEVGETGKLYKELENLCKELSQNSRLF